MTDKPQTDANTSGYGWARTVIVCAIVVTLLIGTVLVVRAIPVTRRYYTDADTIRQPLDQASTRDILWQPPRELSELINTTADDYEPTLSGDGLTLYFVRGKAGSNADIFVSLRTADGWTEPEPLAGVNSDYDDLGPEPAADGASLYFYSDRPGGAGGYDLWVARRGPGGWRTPANLGTLVNSEFNDYGPALTPDGTVLYFASNRPRPDRDEPPDPAAWPATLREDLYQRDYDLYMAPISEAGFAEARPLVDLNTPYNDGAPAVSTFGDFLYFASDRPGGRGGFDLYRSRRLRGRHEPPESIGHSVNTVANELDPGLSLGGYALYFSSDRKRAAAPADGPSEYNLYYTTSREVFTEAERLQRPPLNWGAVWSSVGPNLLVALVALLLLLLLLALLRDARGRRLSLLARCLLASLAAHLILLLLFNAWEVTATLAKDFRRRGPIQIALASPSAGSDLFTQIRGQLTSVKEPTRPSVSFARRTTPLEMQVEAPTADLPVEHQPITISDQSRIDATLPDATVDSRSLTPDPADPLAVPPPPAEILAALPAGQARVQAAEPDIASVTKPIRTAPVDRPAPAAAPVRAVASAVLPPIDAAASEADQRSGDTSLTPAEAAREAAPVAQRTDSLPVTHDALPSLPSIAEALPRLDEDRSRAVPEAVPRVAARHAAGPRPPVLPALAADQTMDPLRHLRPAEQDAPPVDASLADDLDAYATQAAPDKTDAVDRRAAVSAPALETLGQVVLAELETTRAAATSELPTAVALADLAAVRAEPEASMSAKPDQDTAVRLAPETPVDAGTALSEADTEPWSALSRGDVSDTDTSRLPSPTVAPAAPAGALPAVMPLRLAIGLPAQAARHESKEPPGPVPSAVDGETPRAADSASWTMATPDSSMEHFAPHATDVAADSPAPASLAILDLSEFDATAAASRVTTPRLPSDTDLSPDPALLDLGLPRESRAPDDPYRQRRSENRLAIVKRLGGSEETEAAVVAALRWLARHQSSDGRWDSRDFDESCGECGGRTDVNADHGVTGLALLSFLGAGHTHVTGGPYRTHVDRALTWLLDRQRSDGDLRGEETMYSHGIATIALSEAYGMTRDQRLADPVRRAVAFIDRARNTDAGGWRYDPGQAGDCSVLGWQIMALKSANLSGIPVPAESFRAARTWLDRVARGRHGGLYAYKRGRSVTPSMTAEAMFVQQLLGRRRDEPRMEESARYLGGYPPDGEEAPNTYYWYYATLALFQHQGAHWPPWNKAVTGQLTTHQRRDGKATGSWDPVGEWADKGGRVYQTALCALTLEVYYRYLPLYAIEPVDDAVGRIRGLVVDSQSGEPLDGAAVRLVLPDRPAVVVTTDDGGRYALSVPEVPDYFALSASHEGFSPESKNVDAAMVQGTELAIDFSLSPASEALVAIESVPDVHHLGDNRFEGRINSQFQKESEGASFSATFSLASRQLPPHYTRAEVRLLAKGVQRSHKIRINATTLDDRLDDAPDDGSFGEFVARFDPGLLREGGNRIEIIARPSTSDIDDFEFVNVRIHLRR